MVRLDPVDTPAEGNRRNLGLDLLRCIAILMVMVSHWANNFSYWLGLHIEPQWFYAAWLGVDLFFALSGFLIGRILLDIAYGAPTWRNLGIFMVRRWMRTLPLYYLCLIVLFVFFPRLDDPGRYFIQFATLTQNLLHPMPPGYYFSVSWSLTIEEWFYLLFSVILVGFSLLVRHRGAVVWLVIGLFLLGPLALRSLTPDFMEWDTPKNLEVFYRIDSIGYGVLLAKLHRDGSRLFRAPWLACAAGLVMIAAAWTERLPLTYEQGRVLVHVVMTGGWALCLPLALRLRRAPGWFAATVRMVSAQSYALYMFHETILIDVVQAHLWGPKVLPVYGSMVVAVVLPFLVAFLSYRYFEAPILALRPAQRLG